MQGNRVDVIAITNNAVVGIEQFRFWQRMQFRRDALANVINPINVGNIKIAVG